MDFGNIADWANVIVTALGFAGAVFSFREAKNSNLGISLSDAKDDDYDEHGYEVLVCNNSDDHLILENHFDPSEKEFRDFCENSADVSESLHAGKFINKKIVKQHETQKLWVFQSHLLDFLSGAEKFIPLKNDPSKGTEDARKANEERRKIINDSHYKRRILRLEFEDRGKNNRYRWYMPKWIRNRYIVMLFLDDNLYVKYEVHYHKFRKNCKRCKKPDQKILSSSVYYPEKGLNSKKHKVSLYKEQ